MKRILSVVIVALLMVSMLALVGCDKGKEITYPEFQELLADAKANDPKPEGGTITMSGKNAYNVEGMKFTIDYFWDEVNFEDRFGNTREEIVEGYVNLQAWDVDPANWSDPLVFKQLSDGYEVTTEDGELTYVFDSKGYLVSFEEENYKIEINWTYPAE